MKPYGLLLLCCCWAEWCLAQSFRPGSITLPNGQVEAGEIMVNTHHSTPQRVQFRNAARGTVQLGLRDLSAYELERADGNKERFVRKIVAIDRAPAKPDASDLSASPKLTPDTLFVQSLIESAYSLYEWRDDPYKIHFFVEKDKVETLIRKQYFAFSTGGARKMMTNNQYQRQLLAMAKGCANVKTNYGKLNYTRNDLMAAVADLNACKNAPVRYQLTREKNPVQFGLLAGASRSDVLLSRGATNTVAFSPAIQPSGGLYVLFPIPYTHRRLSLVAEALYRHQVAEGKTPNEADPFFERIYTVDMQYARFNLLGRVSSRILFAQIGASCGYLFDNVSEQTSRYFTPGTPEVTETEPWSTDADNIELALVGGLGIRLGKRLTLEARFDYGNGFSRTHKDFLTNTQTISLFAGFRLF